MPNTAISHHPDCDGFRTAHRVTIEAERFPNVTLYRAACEECGPLHVGSSESRRNLERHYGNHAHEVACDGRCHDWNYLGLLILRGLTGVGRINT